MPTADTDSNDGNIEDLPRIREPLEMAQTWMTIGKGYKFLRPILGLIGVDTPSIDSALERAEQSFRHVSDILTLPDEFNRLLGPRGWVMFDDMNIEVVRSAVEYARTEDWDAAEACLTDFYSAEQVGFYLNRMWAVQTFQSRRDLARLALDDYEAGRYHACIPVVLLLMDGFVNELTENNVGFFAKNVDMTAWNSIAGHSSGLACLSKLMRSSRTRTTTDPVALPYRNGILHGRDLNYASKLVAAKAWAALFAIKEWALKAELGELREPSPDQHAQPSLSDTLYELRRNQLVRASLESWQPRDVVDYEDSDTEPSIIFETETPEHTLERYLTAWARKNFGDMAPWVHLPVEKPDAKPGLLRKALAHFELHEYRILRVEDKHYSKTEILVRLQLSKDGVYAEQRHNFSLQLVHPDSELPLRGEEGASWEIHDWVPSE